MLSRIIRRNTFATRNLRFLSKSEPPPDSEESKIKKLLNDAAVGVDTTPQSEEDQWATDPYVEGTVFNEPPIDPKVLVDPRETSVILFPGQGSQFVGMAKNLIKFPRAKDLFEIASEVLQYVLTSLHRLIAGQ